MVLSAILQPTHPRWRNWLLVTLRTFYRWKIPYTALLKCWFFLMKCAILVFEGLFAEPHNTQIMKLLYRTVEWHVLAKLRMHSDSTLTLLEDLTVEFGKLMHQFRDLTCSQFQMVDSVKDKWSNRPPLPLLHPLLWTCYLKLPHLVTHSHNLYQAQAKRQKASIYSLSSSIFRGITSVIFIYLGQQILFWHNRYVISQDLLQTNLTILFRESSPINLWSGSMALQTRKMRFDKSEKSTADSKLLCLAQKNKRKKPMRELGVLMIVTLFLTLKMKDLICSHFLELMEILQRRYNNWNNAIHFYSQFPLEGLRISFLNSKIIFLGKYWDAISMVTHMNTSLTNTTTQFTFTITHYFDTTQLALTILHMISNMTTTPSIHTHIHLSWFHLRRLNQTQLHISFGMGLS